MSGTDLPSLRMAVNVTRRCRTFQSHRATTVNLLVITQIDHLAFSWISPMQTRIRRSIFQILRLTCKNLDRLRILFENLYSTQDFFVNEELFSYHDDYDY